MRRKTQEGILRRGNKIVRRGSWREESGREHGDESGEFRIRFRVGQEIAMSMNETLQLSGVNETKNWD